MKIKVVGLERAEGISHKSGKPKPYAIASVHAVVKLDERDAEGTLTKGAMGTSYGVDPEVVKRVEHLPLPFDAELVVEDVMRFGKRETKVLDLRPVAIEAARPAPAAAAAKAA